MLNTGNFNPEWGYLAPRPGFIRTARMALLAGAIGTVAGMAVAVTLIDRPSEDLSVAARTMAQSNEPSGLQKSAPDTATAELLDSKVEPVADPPRVSARPVGEARDLKSFAAAESPSAATSQRPTGLSALAEAPAVSENPDAPVGVMAAASSKPVARVQQHASVTAAVEAPVANDNPDAARPVTPAPSLQKAGRTRQPPNVAALGEVPALRDDASVAYSESEATPATAKKPNKKAQAAARIRTARNDVNYRDRDSGGPFEFLPLIGRTILGGNPFFNDQVR